MLLRAAPPKWRARETEPPRPPVPAVPASGCGERLSSKKSRHCNRFVGSLANSSLRPKGMDAGNGEDRRSNVARMVSASSPPRKGNTRERCQMSKQSFMPVFAMLSWIIASSFSAIEFSRGSARSDDFGKSNKDGNVISVGRTASPNPTSICTRTNRLLHEHSTGGEGRNRTIKALEQRCFTRYCGDFNQSPSLSTRLFRPLWWQKAWQ